MNLPLSWLKEFVNVKAKPREIAEKLTLSGSEVEKITDHAAGLSKIVEPVLELAITPNRPDCFSIRGLAREVAALYGLKAKVPPLSSLLGKGGEMRESGTAASTALSVKIQDKKLCPLYCARVIQGVRIGPSPLWLASRLRQIGIKPINNVVDATNYVMYELGHPLHAFDANRMAGDTITIRRAKRGEKVVALDEETYALK
ncbi:MAG: phenylalanine--tRNA ligase subunit beta, partial [Parcubacteria group bacterium]|nr:phenylalanine--tRNA ligase subunit beta [Parcubacteria group bacterium]